MSAHFECNHDIFIGQHTHEVRTRNREGESLTMNRKGKPRFYAGQIVANP